MFQKLFSAGIPALTGLLATPKVIYVTSKVYVLLEKGFIARSESALRLRGHKYVTEALLY